MELQHLLWRNYIIESKGESSAIKPLKNVEANVSIFSEDQELLDQWMQNEISQTYWTAPSLNEWYQIKSNKQIWFT